MVGVVAAFGAFDALPFMDLPAHAGLIALRRRLLSSAYDQRLYVLAPHFGAYSLFRGLGDLLASAVGPVGAVRVLAAASVLAMPLAFLDARRRLHGRARPAYGCAGVVLGFGLMTLFGFATYMLGVAALLVCTGLWLELLFGTHPARPARPWTARAALAAAAAALLFVTHGFAFVLFLGCAGATWLVALARAQQRRAPAESREPRWALPASLVTLAPALALAALAAYQERASALPPGSAPPPQPRAGLLFQALPDKLSLLVTPTLMTRWGVDVAAGLALWAIAIASVVATSRWLRAPAAANGADGTRAAWCARALLVCAALLLAAFAALPHEIGWFGFVDARLLTVLLAFALLATPDAAIGPRLGAAYDRALPVLAAVMVALVLVASSLFQREARGYSEVLARVPPYTRLLNVPLDPDSDVFTGHPFIHYDKLALAREPLCVSDLWFHQGSAVYPRPGNPVLDLPSGYLSSDLRGFDWQRVDLAEWDCVLVRTRAAAAAPRVPGALRLVDHAGGWWLYATSASAVTPVTPTGDR
jgi:hypothetical protein